MSPGSIAKNSALTSMNKKKNQETTQINHAYHGEISEGDWSLKAATENKLKMKQKAAKNHAVF